MTIFRLLLAGLWLILAIYTAIVVANHGMDLLQIFFGDIAELGWPGQFNLDFLLFLILSALWTAWRSGFSGAGLGLALFAFFGGAGFLLPYLIFLSFKEEGDLNRMLLGARARRDGPGAS